jgi:replicative DNA helicase
MSTDVGAPHDLDLERSILAMILEDNAVIDQLDRLEGNHFFDVAYREVFLAARDLRAEHQRVNLVTLSGRMGGDPLGGKATVLEALRQFSFNGQAPNAHDVADSLIALFVSRQMQSVGQRLADSVWDYSKKRADVIEATMRELDTLLACQRLAKRTSWDFQAGMDDMLLGLDADASQKFIPTDLKSLDDITGGMRRGDLMYLGGRPSMGKTATAISMLVGAAKVGHGVLFHSLEMDKDAVLMRVASEAAYSPHRQLPYTDAIHGRLSQPEREAFVRAALSRAALPIIIDERAGLSAMQIAMETRKAQTYFERQDKRLGLVVVDHLTKVRPSKHYRGNKNNEVGEISGSLKDLAKSEDVAVLCLAQLNRAVEGREEKRPTLADLRDSGEIEQDADMVLFAYREAYYLARSRHDDDAKEKIRLARLKEVEHILELSIAKSRHGPHGKVDFFCDMGSNVVTDLDRRVA